MKSKVSIQSVINTTLVVWVVIWFYYLLFNWDVFRVQLNTNLGFTTVNIYPFLFFLIIGLLGFIILKYAIHFSEMQYQANEKESKNKIKMLEKEIEVLKLKEVLFRMQTDGLSKGANSINALHSKLDDLSDKFSKDKKTEKSESKK